MRARILLTNGSRTIDLLWLRHEGTDVYCGHTKMAHKWSYHGSGKYHFKAPPDNSHGDWRVPLKELNTPVQFFSTTFGNPSKFLEEADSKYEYSGRKSDTLLVVDVRSIPEGYQAHIDIGLVPPDKPAWLGALATTGELLPDLGLSCSQLIVSTSVNPWVYARIQTSRRNS